MDIAAGTPLLVTHNGKFHCDEVLAYVVLCAAHGYGAPGIDHRLIRTRDAATIARGDIVWDVGTVFDEATCRFDHHQRGAPTRPDGTPFSAAGLVWRLYGERAVAAMLPLDSTRFAAAIAADLDEQIVRRVDLVDNGLVRAPDPLNFTALIGDLNPQWDEVQDAAALDAAFLRAAALARGVLERRVDALRARLAAEAHVLAAHRAGADKRILTLERGMPWKAAAFAHKLPVIYCVSPVPNGNWVVEAMPPEPGSFAQKMPLPEAWAGLENEALVAASGVLDAVFVHLRRFMGAARSRGGALALARLALAAGEAAAAGPAVQAGSNAA